jgi:hypothetical protein
MMQLVIIALLAICVALLAYLAVSHHRAARPTDVYDRMAERARFLAANPDAVKPGAVPLAHADVHVDVQALADAIIPQDFSKADAHTKPRDPRPYDDRIREAVAKTIDGLRHLNVRSDPLLTSNLSHLVGVIGSAISRHGHLIELAMFEALNDQKHFAVWKGQPIKIPDGRGGGRLMPVDLIVFDARDSTIRAYEIKRGFSEGLSSHVERQTRSSLTAVEPYLKDFAASQHLTAVNTFVHVFSYYGRSMSTAGDGPTLNEYVMDEHFETPGLRAECETMTAIYKAELVKLLNELDLWSDTSGIGATRIGTVQREQAQAS